MARSSHPRNDATLDHADTLAAPTPPPPVATPEPPVGTTRIHVRAGGQVLIDLTDGDPTPTTDMACPNCGGALRVEHIGTDLRTADMHCLECHFQFAQRLILRADDRAAPESPSRGRFGRKRR